MPDGNEAVASFTDLTSPGSGPGRVHLSSRNFTVRQLDMLASSTVAYTLVSGVVTMSASSGNAAINIAATTTDSLASRLDVSAALNLASDTDLTIGSDAVFDVATDVIGAGALNKAGGGTLSLSKRDSVRTGATNLADGTISLFANHALGSGALAIGASGVLSINSESQSVGPLSVALGGSIFGAVPTVLTVNQIQAGDVEGDALSGAISLVKNGHSPLTLGGGSFTGATTINDGLLELTNGNALASSSSLTINAGGTLDLAGRNLTTYNVNALSGEGTVNGLAPGSHTLAIKSGGGVFSGTIRDVAGRVALQYDSTGITYLSGSENTYSGGTTVNAGILLYGDSGSSPASVGKGTVTINGGTFALFRAADYAFGNALAGAGRFDKNLDGIVTLTGDNSQFTGQITINAGTLKASDANSLGNKAPIEVNAGATLDVSALGDVTIGALSGAGTVATQGFQIVNVYTAGNSSTFSGSFTGSTSIDKYDSGTLTLSGDGSNFRELYVSGGTIALTGSNPVSANLAVCVYSSAMLDISGIDASSLTIGFVGRDGGSIALGGKKLIIDDAFDFQDSDGGLTLIGSDGADALEYRTSFFQPEFGAFRLDTLTLENWTEGVDVVSVLAGDGDDIVIGTGFGDVINGGGGNDTLTGGGGNDTLTGGSGADTFVYAARGFGNDTITDFAIGDDKIDLSALGIGDFETIQPYINGYLGTSSLIRLVFNGVSEQILVSNVPFSTLDASDFIFNTSEAAKTVSGTDKADLLFGGLGQDTLNGGAGDDVLTGGAGEDTLIGGAGNDYLIGGSGNDIFAYQARGFGNDTILNFAAGFEKIDVPALGIADLPSLQPFVSTTDSDFGHYLAITLQFNGQAETITLSSEIPVVLSETAFIFDTSTNAKTVTGSAGSDVLFGGNGNDTLNGGGGVDTLTGGAGDDTLTGGGGADTFIYSGRGFGQDTITDFTRGQDKIDLSKLGIPDFATLQQFIVASGTSDSAISFNFGGQSETITLKNITPGQLVASNFIFNTSTTALTPGATELGDYLFGGRGADTLNGLGGADLLIGAGGADTLNGGGGADTLIGGSGADTLNGGAGNDLAVYTVARDTATVTRNAVSRALSVNAGADGNDTLNGVEQIKFSDGLFSYQFAAPGPIVVADFAVGAGGWTSQNLFPRHVADVNGDGFGDIAGFGQSGVLVAYGSAQGTFASAVLVTSDFGQTAGWLNDDRFHRELALVNGDSRADIVGFGQAGTLVSLARADGTYGNPALGASDFGAAQGWSSQDLFARTLADLNNDGRADIVGFGQNGTLVALGNGNGTFQATKFGVNNFGVAQGWTSDTTFHRAVADVNNDGKADIVGFGQAGVLVALGKGDGTFADAKLVLGNFGRLQGWASNDTTPRLVSDLNNDGNADIVGFGLAGVFVAYGNGDGTFTDASFDLANFTQAQGWSSDAVYHREIADLNNDGLPDIIGFGLAGVIAAMN